MPKYFLMYTCTLYNIVIKFLFQKANLHEKNCGKKSILHKNERETEKHMFIQYIVDHDRISMSNYTA